MPDEPKGSPQLDEVATRLAHLPDPIALLEALFAHSPVAYQIYRADGHSLLTNQAFRELFGSEPPPEYNVLRDEIVERSGALGFIHRAFAGETIKAPTIWYDPRELEQVTVTEGRRVAITSTFFPLYDRDGAVAYVGIAFQDVTAELLAQEEADERRAQAEAERQREAEARKQAEEAKEALREVEAQLHLAILRERAARTEAEDANRAKDDFLAMLGHELRNPLSPIRSALEVLDRRAGDAFAEERAVIARQVAQLVRLVDDLLDIARITRGQIALRQAPVEIGVAVADALLAARPLIDERRHQVIVDVPDSGVAVFGDEPRLIQIVTNLLTNAAKYTPAGGRITIRARREGDQVRLDVTDTGMGMAPELVARVFERFVQGRRDLARSEGGLGLGLTIVKRIVELHGGTVAATSPGPGRGSTFTVRLPAAEAISPPAQVTPSRATSGKRRYLVVDDNRDAADMLAELLGLTGDAEVEVCYDGIAALAERDPPPDVVLLDLGLPGIDGFEVARRLRARHPDLPIIAVSGYGTPSDRDRARDAGCDAHLVKPVDTEVLLETIEAMVAPRETHRPEDPKTTP